MTEGIRLQKYIAMCGVASRRKAEELIESGAVELNGAVVSVQGCRVLEGDTVTVNGRVITPEANKIYILLNKPRGVMSTASDDRGRRTVLDCIDGINERLYPVGRLDYNTSGLIILSNDGAFTKYMTHPSHQVTKTYLVTADRDFSDGDIEKLKRGVDIGGYVTAPAVVQSGRFGLKKPSLKITIREGKNRQVRRMVEAVGRRVHMLKRVQIGNITDNRLKPGEWRHLTPKEVRGLGYDAD